jgi:hypothetical protein
VLRISGCRALPLIRTLVVTALTVTVVSLAGLQTAAADHINCRYERNSQDKLVYVCDSHTPGEDGDNGDGDDGGGEPTCDLSLVEGIGKTDAARWCEGTNACWANIPAVLPESEWPPNPPSPDAEYIYKQCYDANGNQLPGGGWEWYSPNEPSIDELAQEAYGALEAPAFTLAFSPPEESVIYLDTWWWVEGAPEGDITGSAALGVVAVAEPDHMEVDPGDGSDTFTCDFVTAEDDECTYIYERASDGDGYPARARLVYDVHFEQNGDPIEVTGVPDTFETPWEETAVPVTEVQSNVIR